MVEANDYDVLHFFLSSRSFRNKEDAVEWKKKFREAGMVLVFTQQGRISGNQDTALQGGMDKLIDEQKLDELSMYVSLATRQKFERGLHNGTAPLGYQRIHGAAGDPTNGELASTEAEARTVRKIFDLYLTGQNSDLDVARIVNGEMDPKGEPVDRTKRGLPFTEASIRTILINPIYISKIVWHRGEEDEEVREGRHAPIIEADRFDKVQTLRRSRVHFRGRRPMACVYPLTRRATCFHCRTPVAGDAGGKKGYRRMRHARTGLACEGRTQSADRLEAQAGAVLSEVILLPKDWLDAVRRLLSRPADAGKSDARRR